ncbi:hypothetical protein PsW64_03359 [Pseudovibrio sp. W64]|uniref:hypothetical protein n=1 Tax=Pseudovibrio sp. W64 TaxID=1735583 RepID=UPI0007AEE2DA|nr:hypothetical protein [Pseudovibrio sp. W64]KZK79015.1 hypothetical protein PsW64_03359 [Pseudovibrio sp. W64]
MTTTEESHWSVDFKPGKARTSGSACIVVMDKQRAPLPQKFFVKGVSYSPIPCGAGQNEPEVGDWFFTVNNQPGT